jgi:HEAT repeat protein
MIMTYVLLMALFIPDFAMSGVIEMPGETNALQVANQNFITVDGSSLKAKMDSATRMGRGSARSGKFWLGYQFNPKPGVMIDSDWRGKKGEGVNVTTDSKETSNVGVFLLREAENDAITRVEIYNLDRQHDFNGYPVYWLGRATNDESLNLLKELVDKDATEKVGERATMALALHNDSRVGTLLENIVRNSTAERIRKSAVFWLGQTEGETPFLSELVRNEQESIEIRKQAAFAIGVSQDGMALTALQNLYGQVTNREVKKQVIFAAFVHNKQSDNAVDFLIQIAEKETDREVRKQAIFWLGQKAGQRALEVLGTTVEKSDEDTEVQKQAVFSISQRKKDESVPMLIKIAKTHAKPEVRKQALFWLGQIDDERALELFKEILSK